MTDLSVTGDLPRESASTAATPPLGLAQRTNSFDAVYDECFDFVRRSARALGVRPANLDDVVQDVFIVVHRRLSSFEGRSSLRTWIMGILVNVVRDSRRLERRKGNHETLPEEVLDHRGNPAQNAEISHALSLVLSILDTMPDPQRTVFVLAEVEELGAKEIAKALAIPINTVYSRLRAARGAFASAIQRFEARSRRQP